MRASLVIVAIAWAVPSVVEPGEHTVLRDIGQIRALSPEEGASALPVHIRGVVTHFDEKGSSGLILHDGHAGQFIVNMETYFFGRPRVFITRGDLVEIEGETAQGGFAPNVRPHTLRRLGRGVLPRVRHPPLSALLSGRYDCEYVEVVGVGQRAWLSTPWPTMFLDMALEGGTMRATFWDYSSADLTRFIDARVRLRGNVGTLFSQAGQLRGVALFAGRTADVVVEEPPPEPASLPARAVSSLYRYSPAGEGDRRIRIQGVVTCQILGRPVDVTDDSTTSRFRHVSHVVYVRDSTGGARIETEEETLFHPGDRVDVVGFPAVTPGKPILRHATLRKLGSETEPQPAVFTPQSMLAAEYDAELVRVRGQVLGTVTSPAEHVLVVRAGEDVFEAALPTAVGEAGFDALRPGSVVSVAGVYAFQAGPPPSFRLLLRSPRDVALVGAPPWWTVGHTLVTLAIVGFVGVAATFWVRAMARKNVVIREQWQAILTERSRLARELHDTLEQGLAGVKLQIEAVAGSLPVSPPRARESLDVARQMLRYCLDEARRAIMDLRSQALESGDLVEAFTRMTRQMTTGGALTADVRVFGAPRRLDGPEEHHLLRIGLEALTNAVKHSGARRVEIDLHFNAQSTDLIVRDDGRGFAESGRSTAGGGFGLRGIRERVDKMGGILRIDSSPGGGTEVAVSLPLRTRGTREVAVFGA